ncbi:hypothetical protein FHR92_000420 [Fontibacillus solani]|uniref:Uncharacterized protein n=1 Tax=Fontibacillus solani TaxID=1572857 RepID=A0A7W3SPS7_9BACL|nr:hypothetical protein [Fontibacillus solani]
MEFLNGGQNQQSNGSQALYATLSIKPMLEGTLQ